MKKSKKKALSLLLTLCMVVAMLPALGLPALAAGSITTEAQLIEALQSDTPSTIILGADITLDEVAVMGANHTLNTAGYTLTTHFISSSAFGRINIGTHTLTVNGGGAIWVRSSISSGLTGIEGTLNLENITVNLHNSSSNGIQVRTVNVGNNATINLNSATGAALITLYNNTYTLNVNSGGKINIQNFSGSGISCSGTMTIESGGAVTVGSGGGNNRGIFIGSTGTLNMNGGTLTGTTDGAVYLAQGAKVTGMDNMLNDQGTGFTETGSVTVGAAGTTPSATGLSAGLYIWDGTSLFAKGTQLAPSIAVGGYDSSPRVGALMTATLGTYTANDGGEAGTHAYKWYRADDFYGTNAAVISGETAINYTPVTADFGKYICIEVTPVGSAGLTGQPTKHGFWQVGVQLTATATGAGGGSATVGGVASTVVYSADAVDIAVAKSNSSDTVAWSASPAVGTFGSTTAASTTYTPPSAPTGNITLTATLTAAGATTHTVNFSVTGGNGSLAATVDGGGIFTGAPVEQGKTVVFTATPNSGYRVKEWKDNSSVVNSTNAIYTLSNITAAHTVTVEFEVIPTYLVTVNSGTGGGSYAQGTIVTITANTPPSGQQFKEWTINGGGATLANAQAQSTSFTMPANAVEVTATYENLPAGTYSITVQNDGNGTANANVNSAQLGAAITRTATPPSGYRFKEWQAVSPTSLTITGNQFTMPGANVVVKAIFEAAQIDISAATISGISTSYTYTGSAITPEPTVTFGGVALVKSTDYTVSYSNNVNVGTATITLTGIGAYTGTATKNFTISSGSGGTGGGATTPSTTITAPTTDKGWSDAAKKVNDLKDGAEFTLDMKNSTTVSGDFLADIAGKDVDLTFDMGDGMRWTVNGQDIPQGPEFAALNLGVSTGEGYIPAEVRNIDGSISEVQLRLSHNGELPFAMTLSVKLDKVNAGNFANLYYYNEATGALEFKSAVKIAVDGTAELAFDHASDYLIVVAKTSLAPVIWQNPFIDVTASNWFYGDVQYAVEQGLFAGTSATTFSPNTPMTRAMLVTVLWRLEGEPVFDDILLHTNFADVVQGAYYENAVGWAAKNEIVSGYGEGFFGPDDNVTREQFATILYRYAGSPALQAGLLEFNDAGQVSDWAWDAMVWATYEGIITGKPGNLLDPQGSATRAEAAAMLHRFLAK